MENYVVYHNELNKVAFKNFKASEYDLFFFLWAQMRDRGIEVMEFDIAEIRRAMNYRKHISLAEFAEMIKSTCDKIGDNPIKIDNFGGDQSQFRCVFFSSTFVDMTNMKLRIRINPDAEHFVNNLSREFTQFELKEFLSLQSKYSKTIYRLLKQFRSTGRYYVGIDELREKVGCPETKENRDFTKSIVKQSVEELKNIFDNLTLTVVRDTHKRGKPLIGYQFAFTPEAKDKKRRNTIDEFNERNSSKIGKGIENVLEGYEANAEFNSYEKHNKENDSNIHVNTIENTTETRQNTRENKEQNTRQNTEQNTRQNTRQNTSQKTKQFQRNIDVFPSFTTRKRENVRKNSFNNFDQREYDYKALERILLDANEAKQKKKHAMTQEEFDQKKNAFLAQIDAMEQEEKRQCNVF